MDISYFMTWFVAQVVTIFTWTYTTLNNIEFGGTSLLKVIIFINIIVPFLYVILSIPRANQAYKDGYKKGKEDKKNDK